jgi:hypothetical protein
LDRVAGRGIRLRRLAACQDPLGHLRQADVRQFGETMADALACAVLGLAGRFREAETLACFAEFALCVAVRQRRDDLSDKPTQQR